MERVVLKMNIYKTGISIYEQEYLKKYLCKKILNYVKFCREEDYFENKLRDIIHMINIYILDTYIILEIPISLNVSIEKIKEELVNETTDGFFIEETISIANTPTKINYSCIDITRLQ